MSKNLETVENIKKRAMELKKEFDEEIKRILSDVEDGCESPKSELYRKDGMDNDDLQEYENRLESLKDELKKLKKIKKQQKKINKLEEEREDVIHKIEKKRKDEKRIKSHQKH